MNINELSDQEKSVMLAKLCGWNGPNYLTGPQMYAVNDDNGMSWLGVRFDLYDPVNMALAWRVLNWAAWNPVRIDDSKSKVAFVGYMNFGHLCQEKLGDELLLFSQPEIAQRAWLDKILSLAIEAGMVE